MICCRSESCSLLPAGNRRPFRQESAQADADGGKGKGERRKVKGKGGQGSGVGGQAAQPVLLFILVLVVLEPQRSKLRARARTRARGRARRRPGKWRRDRGWRSVDKLSPAGVGEKVRTEGRFSLRRTGKGRGSHAEETQADHRRGICSRAERGCKGEEGQQRYGGQDLRKGGLRLLRILRDALLHRGCSQGSRNPRGEKTGRIQGETGDRCPLEAPGEPAGSGRREDRGGRPGSR